MRLEKRLFSSSYTVFSEMVVTDRKSDFAAIPSKKAFKEKQVFYDLVDEYWNEDFWKTYNIIEPTESLEHAVSKLKSNPVRFQIVFLYLETNNNSGVC